MTQLMYQVGTTNLLVPGVDAKSMVSHSDPQKKTLKTKSVSLQHIMLSLIQCM